MTKTYTITIVSVLFILNTAFGQGTLTPPGPPAPTMKSLAQIEPRTPITSAPYSITNPDSYYLPGNVIGVVNSNGININADNVTVDLDGFALTGVANSSTGVSITGIHTNITVRNGSIGGWEFYGISSPSTVQNVVIDHLNVSSGSTSADPILAYNALISDCAVSGGLTGIQANSSYVYHCLVVNCSSVGIGANNSSVVDCQIQNCGVDGIFVNLPGCQIVGNMLKNNNVTGNSSGAGIYINDSNNRIENNQVTGSGVAGIVVNNASYINNVVIKNTVTGNGANNYVGTGGNDFGPIGSAATATSPWANISH